MRLAYQLENHPVHFIIAAPDFSGTAQELWESVVQNQPELSSLTYIEVSAEDFPLINTNQQNSMRQKPYRNSWKLSGDKILHDMSAAKDIHLTNIRRRRADKLKELDTEFTVAERNGEDLTELNALRLELLAATDEVKNGQHTSAEKLYAAWPTALENRK